MDDFDIDRIERESKERNDRMKKTEDEGLKGILQYFDRIHNNIFTYNNILIAGFFTLAQLSYQVPKWTILVPILNFWILICIDYRMMEKSRFESSITDQSFDKIKKHGAFIARTNLLSLISIGSTFLITIFFLFCIWKK